MKWLKIISKHRYEILIALVIAASLFLYFKDLAIKPVWYSDEGSTLDVAWNLIHGKMRYLGISNTFIPHLPLFYMLSGIFIAALGKTILAIRILAILCVTASVFIAYLVGKEIWSKKMGLLVSAIYFIFPCVLVTSRYALSSTLGVLELSLVMLFSVKYLKTKNEKWIFYLASMLALTLITEIFFWGMLIALPLLLWPEKKKLLFKALAVSFSFFVFFIVTMLIIDRRVFLDDIKFFYFYRIFTPQNFAFSPFARLLDILESWSISFWYWAGPLGLFFSGCRKISRLFVFLFLAIFIPLLSFISKGFLIRNQILLVFLISFGTAFLIARIYSYIFRLFKSSGKTTKYALFLILVLITLGTFDFAISADINFFSDNQTHLKEMRFINSTVSFLNKNTASDDYIITSDDSFSHLLKSGKVANIYQATAYEGLQNSVYNPLYLDHDRFYFDASVNKARFAVYDESLQGFFKDDEPNIVKAFERINQWPLAQKFGHYEIRQNPNFQ